MQQTLRRSPRLARVPGNSPFEQLPLDCLFKVVSNLSCPHDRANVAILSKWLLHVSSENWGSWYNMVHLDWEGEFDTDDMLRLAKFLLGPEKQEVWDMGSAAKAAQKSTRRRTKAACVYIKLHTSRADLEDGNVIKHFLPLMSNLLSPLNLNIDWRDWAPSSDSYITAFSELRSLDLALSSAECTDRNMQTTSQLRHLTSLGVHECGPLNFVASVLKLSLPTTIQRLMIDDFLLDDYTILSNVPLLTHLGLLCPVRTVVDLGMLPLERLSLMFTGTRVSDSPQAVLPPTLKALELYGVHVIDGERASPRTPSLCLNNFGLTELTQLTELHLDGWLLLRNFNCDVHKKQMARLHALHTLSMSAMCRASLALVASKFSVLTHLEVQMPYPFKLDLPPSIQDARILLPKNFTLPMPSVLDVSKLSPNATVRIQYCKSPDT